MFRHDEALACIERDYLGDDPLLGAEFQLMFRLSRGRFQLLTKNVMASNISFVKSTSSDGLRQSILGACLLLPLKTLAHGVPPHIFIDYFQMSQQYSRECCKKFDKAMKQIYMKKFLRLPTETDLKNIAKLHQSVHSVDGLLGSLDCTHAFWKNCPKPWQGSCKGKELKPLIVLEAVAGYGLFLWHALYGYTGMCNDTTILSLFPLMDKLTDGMFHEVEEEAGVIPFEITDDEFTKKSSFLLMVYRSHSRFESGINEPVSSKKEENYTSWQEGARKDVERAFNALKNTWQFLDRPSLLHDDLKDISNRVVSCLLLHNILVTDRVVQEGSASYNYRERHDSSKGSLAAFDDEVEQPTDIQLMQAAPAGETRIVIGINNAPPALQAATTRTERFAELNDLAENRRLHKALMDKFNA
jgi:hypothetical protein